jgi:plasmid stabilization system protein ParE
VTAKPVIPRERAVQDVESIVDHYLAEDAERAALAFIDALEEAFVHIGSHPATGSPRFAFELVKIEKGESLLLSWLRQVKGCQIVQTNWKASVNSWDLIMKKTSRSSWTSQMQPLKKDTVTKFIKATLLWGN